MSASKIALVGERDLTKKAHQGIEASLALYRRTVNPRLDYDWIDSASITMESVQTLFRDMTGIWCTPGSPYASTDGALLAINHARIEGKTFLGTCGGFQHALMEFAQNVLQRDAQHEELTPGSEGPLITKLSCSLIEAQGKVLATSPALFAGILGAEESMEEFHCNYGMNGDLAGIFENSHLKFVAHDELGQIRAFRLIQHTFFVGTLFQPERRALTGQLHPVVDAFFKATEPPPNRPDRNCGVFAE